MKKSHLLGLAALVAQGSLPVSAATVLFADNFNRGNNTNLNASTDGKSGTLGNLSWNETAIDTTNGGVLISGSQMLINSGTGTNLSSVPYVDHNFIADGGSVPLTTITVAFDFISASNSGSTRQLGFGIGNSKSALDALISSGQFGDIGISIDLATTVSTSGFGPTGVQIFSGGSQAAYVDRTITSGDTFSATFTFANMNAGTPINYEVFHKTGATTSGIYTGTGAWSGTNQNYIGIFNNHRQSNASDQFIDNFVVSIIPEPCASLLGSLGMLALLRRRR